MSNLEQLEIFPVPKHLPKQPLFFQQGSLWVHNIVEVWKKEHMGALKPALYSKQKLMLLLCSLKVHFSQSVLHPPWLKHT